MAKIIDQNEATLDEGEEFVDLKAPIVEEPALEEDNLDELEAKVINNESDDDEDIPVKFRGKDKKDIAKAYKELEKEFGRRNNEIGELRKLTDDLLKLQINKGAEEAPSKKKLGVDDLLDDPEQAISHAIENNPRLKQLEETLKQASVAKEKEYFESKHPDAYELVQTEDFQQFVTASPVLLKAFQEANQNYDYKTADDIMNMYKNVRMSKKQEAVEERGNKAKKELGAATVEKGNSGQSTRKIFRRADILRMVATKDPKFYDEKFQAELEKAYAEGRVK